MAEKRHLGSIGTVSYSKLPRLTAEPDQRLAADFCKSGDLPNYASETCYGYKGSYFTYPLRYHDGPKPLTHWTPPEAYPHCVGGTASPQLKTEKALCMLESFVARGQALGHEKSNECTSRDAFNAQERWAGYMGYPGYVPQGWIHSYMAQQSPQAPTGCSPLAMPKPIYRHHVYSTKSGYSLKSSLDLGMVTESALQQPLGMEWAVPPSGHLNCTENAGCGISVSKKAAVAEATFPQLSPRPKDAAGFSPYPKSFEQCQAGQTASVLEGSYASMCNSQKNISEMHGNSFGKHSWPKLPPSASPMAHPPSLMYQDRSCYPLTSYPYISQEQMYLYHPSYAQAERPNSLLACKSFDSPGTDESPIHPGSYFSPPTPRSCHSSHLESYPYNRTGPPMTPPGPRLSKEQEHQPRPIAKVAQSQKTSYGASLSPRDWHKDRRVPEQAKENFASQQPASQSGTLQRLHSLDQSPGFFGDFAQIQETDSGVSVCPSEKAKTREKDSSQVLKPSSLSCDAKNKSVVNHKIESGACIIISDSPVTPRSQQALDVPEGLAPFLHNGPQSPKGRGKGVIKGPKTPQPPPSPPMPVINNVFSLAPYRDYLEGSSVSLEIPLSKTSHLEVTSPKDKSVDVPHLAQPNYPKSSEVLGEKDAGNPMSERNRKELNNSSIKRENGDGVGTCDNIGLPLLSPKGFVSSQSASNSCVTSQSEEMKHDYCVLDLSCKTESLVDNPCHQKGSSKSNGTEVGTISSNGQELLPETNRPASELPVQSSSEKRGNFQSSATFLFKKFKIRKSLSMEAGSVVQQAPSLSPTSQIAASPSGVCSVPQGPEQVATWQNSPIVPQSPLQNSPRERQSPNQGATQQSSSLVQDSCLQVAAQPETMQRLQLQCVNIQLPDTSTVLLPSTTAGSPVLGTANVSPPAGDKPPEQQSSPGQYFTDLHSSVCAVISCSVSASSPEQLKEWLEKAESEKALKEKAMRLAKHKNGVKSSDVSKQSKGKQVWLAFKDVVALFRKLLSQLDTFMLTHKCPFPHVVRAGAIFIPIHVVKEKLFPNLPGTSVDHVLQNHKVELRPTTLSEEKLLRDLELKSCTSRMLKLLALKQLPDIYPDLLTLHWHNCIKQQLGDRTGEVLNCKSRQ